jgi:hypothetical protein
MNKEKKKRLEAAGFQVGSVNDFLNAACKKKSSKVDPKTNTCFSIANEVYKKNAKTKKMYRKQREKFGFDDTETWHLDRTMALFLIPRLKRFIQVNNGIPNGETIESYEAKIWFIIKAFENYYSNDKYYNSVDNEREKLVKDVKQALEYLNQLWFELWW